MSVESYYLKASRFIGLRYGQQCNVYRPPLGATVDQTPTLIYSGKIKVEISTSRLSQALGSGIEHYTIFGRRDLFQKGDIIVPTGGSNTTTPPVTIASYSPLEECIGFKTSRIGAIKNGTDNVFTNIYFDFVMDSNYPGSALNKELKDSLGVPSLQAIMFNRTLHTSTRDEEGLILYETDTPVSAAYQIIQATSNQTFTILDLKRADLI
jgi:hypothetical protein